MDNDMKFKIVDFRIQDLMFFYMSPEITVVKAKVNNKFEQMGFVATQDLYDAMTRVLARLKEGEDES
jgi:hypothetical protein